MLKRFLCILLSLMLLTGMTAALAEEPAAEAEVPVTEAEAPAAEAEAPAAEAEAPAAEADTPAAEAEAPAAEAEAPAESDEPVLLATINGREILSDHEDIKYWRNYYLYQLANSGYDTSNAEMLDIVNRYALYNTMRFEMIRQKAAELGFDQLSDEEKASMEEEARTIWEEAVTSYMQNITDESTDDERAAARAEAVAVLESYGYEEESYIAECISSQVTNLLISRMTAYLSEGLEVTDEEVQAHFDELVEADKAKYEGKIGNYEIYTQYYQQPSYYTPEGYRGISHILLKVDETLLNTWKDITARFEEQEKAEAAPEEAPAEEASDATAAEPAEPTDTPAPTAEPVTEEMVEAAKQAILDSVQPTVDEIMAKLEDGASFDDLILEYGTDPGMQNEATRAAGYPVHKESVLWDPAFTAGAIALEKVGDVSEPVLGQYGVHILYYLRDIPGGAVELTETMKNQFREEMLENKRSTVLNTALEQWMDEAEIVYTEAGEAWKIPDAAGADGETSSEAAESAGE